MKRYKCIVFDLDGTMLDTEEMNLIPLQRLIKEVQNKDVLYEDLLKYRAYPGRKALEMLDFTNIEKSYSKWVRYVNEYETGAKLYDGFNELIEKLDEKGILCCIASSKTRAQYEIDFLKTGLDKYMKRVVLAEDTEKHKPHPEPLMKAIENLDINPKEVIYVGDTIADYEATKSAGMDFAFAIWGAVSNKGIEADYNLNEPKDLLKVFSNI